MVSPTTGTIRLLSICRTANRILSCNPLLSNLSALWQRRNYLQKLLGFFSSLPSHTRNIEEKDISRKYYKLFMCCTCSRLPEWSYYVWKSKQLTILFSPISLVCKARHRRTHTDCKILVIRNLMTDGLCKEQIVINGA